MGSQTIGTSGIGSYSHGDLLRIQNQISRSLHLYQRERTETAIAFKQAVLRLAGFGRVVDGYF